MRVTVMTDASHDPRFHAGGYGYWVAGPRGRLAGGGPFKGEVAHATLAEIMAICNALHAGLRAGLIGEGDAVLIQSDCEAAMAYLQGRGKTVKKHPEPLAVYQRLVSRAALTVAFRHVSAHTGAQDPRSLANAHCDRRAKAGMRKARERNRQSAHP